MRRGASPGEQCRCFLCGIGGRAELMGAAAGRWGMGKFSSDRFCFLSGIGSNSLVESGGERGNYESGK